MPSHFLHLPYMCPKTAQISIDFHQWHHFLEVIVKKQYHCTTIKKQINTMQANSRDVSSMSWHFKLPSNFDSPARMLMTLRPASCRAVWAWLLSPLWPRRGWPPRSRGSRRSRWRTSRRSPRSAGAGCSSPGKNIGKYEGVFGRSFFQLNMNL